MLVYRKPHKQFIVFSDSLSAWKISKVSLDGDTEIVSKLTRHIVLKHHGNSLIQERGFPRIGCVAHHPPARGPSVSIPTRQKMWLDKRLLYLTDFLSSAAVAALTTYAVLCSQCACTIVIINIIISNISL